MGARPLPLLVLLAAAVSGCAIVQQPPSASARDDCDRVADAFRDEVPAVTVVGVFDANVAALRRAELAADGGPLDPDPAPVDRPWPDLRPQDPGAMCYLDGAFGVRQAGPAVTRVVVTYAQHRDGSTEWHTIAQGSSTTVPIVAP